MFQNILVAVDGSATANRGLKSAIQLASDQHATLTIVHVIDDMAIMPALDGGYVPANYIDSMLDAMRDSGRKVLAKAEKLAQEQSVPAKTVMAETQGRTVAHTILAQARKAKSDVIVLGTHGRRGLTRVLLGSDAETVLREATCPVFLVRAPERASAHRSSAGRSAKAEARAATPAKAGSRPRAAEARARPEGTAG